MARKMSVQTINVLSVMLDDPFAEWYGLQLSREAELATGTLYPILARLEERRWLTSSWEDLDPRDEGRPRRRLYRLTGEGADNARRVVDDALQEMRRSSLGRRLRSRPSLRTREAGS